MSRRVGFSEPMGFRAAVIDKACKKSSDRLSSPVLSLKVIQNAVIVEQTFQNKNN